MSEPAPPRPSAARTAPRTGPLILLLAAGAVGSFVWLALGAIAPLNDGATYVWVTPPLRDLAVAAGLALAGLAALQGLLARVVLPARRLSFRNLQDAWCHWPLLLLYGALAGPAALMHPAQRWSAPVSYLTVDLRFWLLPLVLLLWLHTVDHQAAGALRRALARAAARIPAPARRFWLEALLCGICVTFAIVTTPRLRFNGGVHGDEPKYLRYCENLYQGRGFEVGEIQNVADLPTDYPPQFGRDLRLAAQVIPVEVGNLAHDATDVLRGDWNRPFNRAHYLQAWFVEGKNGGLYQVHTPGLPFLLLPAYTLDRYVLNWSSDYHPQFPTNPWATDSMLLLVYAVWGVVIFRFLRRQTGHEGIAWLLALAVLLCLPVAAFPFQIYPETTAGLVILLVVGYLVFDRSASVPLAFGYGLLAGYLPWLHIRFGAVSAVPLIWMVVAERKRPKLAVAFAGGYTLVVGLFCFYVYHITGSVMPSALYFTQGAVGAFNPAAVIPGATGFVFDGKWGLLPHAPIYLLALAGLPLLIGRRPALAGLGILIVLMLAIPSAGHGYTAAGGTPLRDLVAIMPLLATALAEVFVEYRHSRLFQAIFALLLVVSVQTAAVYNLHHDKAVGPLVDRSISGWHLNLLFPELHQGVTRPLLLAAWFAAAILLVLLPLWRRLVARWQASGGSPSPLLRATWPVLFGLTLVAVVWAARGKPARNPDYLMKGQQARLRVVRLLATHPADRGRTSDGSRITARTFDDAEQAHVQFAQTSPQAVPGRASTFEVKVTSHDDLPAWGHLWIEYGDGAFVPYGVVSGSLQVEHVYAAPGDYVAATDLTLPDGRWLHQPIDVHVRAAAGADTRLDPSLVHIDGLPPPAAAAPATASIDRVMLGPAGVSVRVAGNDAWQGGGATLWVLATRGSTWRVATSAPLPAGTGSPVAVPDIPAGTAVGFMVTRSAAGTGGSTMQRTDLPVAVWPSSDARLGAPVTILGPAGR
ncbi:MAG: hypothetical protein KGN76_14805 [Acidobacteriota bacterium]|nr:hypothetical protein [Acidobacteriota bacterium]